jgi:hypothetical protein
LSCLNKHRGLTKFVTDRILLNVKLAPVSINKKNKAVIIQVIPIPNSRQHLYDLGADEVFSFVMFSSLTGQFIGKSYIKTTPAKFDYFAYTLKGKYGPFDEIFNMDLNTEESVPFFNYLQDKSHYLHIKDKVFGPFLETSIKLAAVETTTKVSTAYIARTYSDSLVTDVNLFVHFNQHKFGPFKNVFNLAISPNGDKASWIAIIGPRWFSYVMDKVVDEGPFEISYGFNEGTVLPESLYSQPKPLKSDTVVYLPNAGSQDLTESVALHSIQVEKASSLFKTSTGQQRLVLFNNGVYIFKYE